MPQKAKLFKLLLRHAGGGGGIGKSEGRKEGEEPERSKREGEGGDFVYREKDGREEGLSKEGGRDRTSKRFRLA